MHAREHIETSAQQTVHKEHISRQRADPRLIFAIVALLPFSQLEGATHLTQALHTKAIARSR